MKQGLTVLAVALALSGGVAAAQTSETTTTQSTVAQPMLAPVPAPLVPVPGTVQTSRESHAIDAYGNRTDSSTSSYRSVDGVARESQTTTTQVPVAPMPPVTTSTTTTRTTTTAVPN
jgi:hypothetical protein